MSSAPPGTAPPSSASRASHAPKGDGRRFDEPPWRVWTAPAAVVAGLAAGQFAVILVDIVGHAFGSSLAHPSPAVRIVGDVVVDAAFVVAAVYFAALHGRPRAADFGFRLPRSRRALGGVLLAALAYYGLTALYAGLVHLHGQDKLPSELGAGRSTAALAAAAIFVCVIAPIAEEFFFRGFLFGALRRWRVKALGHELGPWIAALLVGVLFGLAHTGSASPQYLVPLGFLGFVLCLLRWWTRSLLPCIALHCFNNALALGVNQLRWGAGGIAALICGSLIVITLITLPLSSGDVTPG